jgi:two-component system sensor histidine kinase RpfC
MHDSGKSPDIRSLIRQRFLSFDRGFHFGKRYLFFVPALSLVGFGVAVSAHPSWPSNLLFTVGLWSAILLTSIYLASLIGRLTAALECAESANHSKRRFISSVGNELRVPLSAITGIADLMRRTKLTSGQEDMMHGIDNASQVMLALIEDVQDFSRIEAGELVIENAGFDLRQLIHSTVGIFKYQTAERGLTLISYTAPAVPKALKGDAHHLRQILVNLLSNAVKFTLKGRIALRVHLLDDGKQGARLRFEVEDNGSGMPVDADGKNSGNAAAGDSPAQRYGRPGPDTAISMQLIELMGGKLAWRSEPGSGTTFWFDLTLQRDAEGQSQRAFVDLRTLLIGFAGKDISHITESLRGVAAPWQSVDSLDAALSSLHEAARQVHPFHMALISDDCVNDLSHSAFLPPLIKELRAKAGGNLAVVLCGAQGLDGPRQRVIEDSMLAAWLDFPLEEQVLLNIMHGVKLGMPRSANPEPVLAGIRPPGTPAGACHVLVAEANPTGGKVMQQILERAGHSCTLVHDGEQALDKLTQQQFDLVVMDMDMPVMSGVEATKAYRFMQPAEMRVPIIMLSENVTPAAQEQCATAGAEELLSKPIQATAFLETFDRLVKKFGTAQKDVLPRRTLTKLPVVLQPAGAEVILNYATLAELECIGQNHAFLDDLLAGFMADNRLLIEQLGDMLVSMRHEEFKETLHAIKGSAVSIGALSMATTCQQFEKLPRAELKRDAKEISHAMKRAFDELCLALDNYRKQRDQSASNN